MPAPAQMSRRARRSAAVLAVIIAAHTGGASARAEPPPTPQAAAWLVYAPGHGGYLVAHGIDDERAVASLTKLMTAHLTLRAGRLDDVTTVGEDAATVGESMVPMRAGRAPEPSRPPRGPRHPLRQRRRRGARGRGRRLAGRVRRPDERGGDAAGPASHPLRDAVRARHARAVLERPRRPHPEPARHAEPGLPLLRGSPERRDPRPLVPGPQHAARALSRRRRGEDGEHRRRRVVPLGERRSQRHPPVRGGARRAVRAPARPRRRTAAELGLRPLPPGAAGHCRRQLRDAPRRPTPDAG